MTKNIVPIQKADSDVVDGVIVSQFPLKVLYGIFRVLDFFLFVAFIAVTGWLLKETAIHPMFGLSVYLVRLLWHRIDTRVRKSLGIETPTRNSKKRG